MDLRQREIADFLRTRRARLKPADAGLRSAMRRRTPGLRREEVAELARIGTCWYTFLEQGRDVRPSEGVVRRIARALKLNPAEQRYFLKLTLAETGTRSDAEVVPPEVLAAMRAMAEPVLVLGRAWDVLDFNEASSAVFDYPYAPDRNLIRLVFRPEARLFFTNWEQRARQAVGAFRAQSAEYLRDPRVVNLVDDLAEHQPQFRTWWAEQALSEENSGHWTAEHPFAGRLELGYTMVGVLVTPGIRMGIHYSDGKVTRRRLDKLVHQVRDGQRSPDHNLWTTLGARLPREHTRKGHAA